MITMRTQEPLEKVAFCDFETYHIKDMEHDGVDVRITKQGPRLFENGVNTDLPPEVWVKGGAMVVWTRPDDSTEEVGGIRTVEDMLVKLWEKRAERAYFHNSRFDCSYIIDYIKKTGKETSKGIYIGTKAGETDLRIYLGKVMQGKMGNLYSVNIRFQWAEDNVSCSYSLPIWDSAKIWRMKLDELGKAFGVKKGATTGGSKALAVGWDDEVAEYCMQDCRVLQHAMVQYFKMCEKYIDAPNGFMTGAATAIAAGMKALRHDCEVEVSQMTKEDRLLGYLEKSVADHNRARAQWKKDQGVDEWELADALVNVYLPKLDTTDNLRAAVVDGKVTRDKVLVSTKKKKHALDNLGRWAKDEDGEYIYETDENGDPLFEVDTGKAKLSWFRDGYKGSTPLLDKKKKYTRTGFLKNILIKDINSMFPTQIRFRPMPWGKALDCSVEECMSMMGEKRRGYTWIARMKVCLKVRKGHRGTFILKSGTGVDLDGESSKTLDIIDSEDPNTGIITICEPEWEMLKRDYDVEHGYFEIIEAKKFRTKVGLFKNFIDFWYELKAEAGKEGNKPLRQFCKLILNSFYGKFGSNPYMESYDYTMINGVLKSVLVKGETSKTMNFYLPLAIWTTAYARDLLSQGCNALGWDHVVYTDTDSWHIVGLTEEEIDRRLESIGVGSTDALGDAKTEGWSGGSYYPYGAYIRNKGYMHFDELGNVIVENGAKDIKMGGANKFDNINTMDDLKIENWPIIDGKRALMAQRTTGYWVRGGILLMDTSVNVLEDSMFIEKNTITQIYINEDGVII